MKHFQWSLISCSQKWILKIRSSEIFSMVGLIFVLFNASHTQALVSTETIPQGIRSAMVRFGDIRGVDQKYDQTRGLVSLNDYNSVAFDAKTLTKINQRSEALIKALNQIGNSDLGDKIHLGVLRVDTKPEISYFAPIYAYGLTDRWTLAFGLPVIRYANNVSLYSDGSNLQYYRSQLSGLSAELDQALNTDVAQEGYAVLESKGYKPLGRIQQTFFGDLQLSSLYRFFESDSWSSMYQFTMGLPTGPAYDADDLAAINAFGRTAIDNTLILSYASPFFVEFNPWVSVGSYLPDEVVMRVPSGENDTLPDANQKELVRRELGSSLTFGFDSIWTISDEWSLGAGVERNFKNRDQYFGTRGYRYDLLSQKSEGASDRVKAEVKFSSVKRYQKQKEGLPARIGYNWSDTVAGFNVERRTLHELTVMMFF